MAERDELPEAFLRTLDAGARSELLAIKELREQARKKKKKLPAWPSWFEEELKKWQETYLGKARKAPPKKKSRGFSAEVPGKRVLPLKEKAQQEIEQAVPFFDNLQAPDKLRYMQVAQKRAEARAKKKPLPPWPDDYLERLEDTSRLPSAKKARLREEQREALEAQRAAPAKKAAPVDDTAPPPEEKAPVKREAAPATAVEPEAPPPSPPPPAADAAGEVAEETAEEAAQRKKMEHTRDLQRKATRTKPGNLKKEGDSLPHPTKERKSLRKRIPKSLMVLGAIDAGLFLGAPILKGLGQAVGVDPELTSLRRVATRRGVARGQTQLRMQKLQRLMEENTVALAQMHPHAMAQLLAGQRLAEGERKIGGGERQDLLKEAALLLAQRQMEAEGGGRLYPE